MAMCVCAQADGGGERRIVDVIGQSADALGRRPAHRQVKNLLGDLGHALEQRAPA